MGLLPCFDVDDDPGEERELTGTAVERDMLELLRAALDAVEAPHEQYERLGLAALRPSL
jgi:hypothetical protein